MLILTVFMIFLLVFTAFYGLLALLFKSRIAINKRVKLVKELENDGMEAPEEEKYFALRILLAAYMGISRILLRAMPGSKLAALGRKLEKAGLLKNNTAEKWIFKKFMLMLTIFILTGFAAYMVNPDPIKALIMALIMLLLINVIFNFYLSRKIKHRQVQIQKDLPYALDLIMVSVEAGLSFDGAMARVVNNIKGELCDEFSKSLKEIRMGINRKTALRNMSERCDVKELSMFITSIIQADELGVSLGKVLRIESANLRELRKQLAREKAMKAPVKMLFPLIFFIFPSIFIIILGPAAIKIYTMFIK